MMTGLPVQIRGFQIDDCVLKCNFNLWNWGPKLGIVDLTPPNISLWLLLDLLMMTGRPTSYMIINYIPGPRSLRSPPPHLWYFGRHHVRLRQRFEARHDLTNFFLHIKINVFNHPFFKIELISCSCRNYNTKSNSIESRVTICQFILAKFIYLLLKNKPQQIK